MQTPAGWAGRGISHPDGVIRGMERPYFAARQVPECVSHSDELPLVVRKLWLVVITQLPVSVRLKQDTSTRLHRRQRMILRY